MSRGQNMAPTNPSSSGSVVVNNHAQEVKLPNSGSARERLRLVLKENESTALDVDDIMRRAEMTTADILANVVCYLCFPRKQCVNICSFIGHFLSKSHSDALSSKWKETFCSDFQFPIRFDAVAKGCFLLLCKRTKDVLDYVGVYTKTNKYAADKFCSFVQSNEKYCDPSLIRILFHCKLVSPQYLQSADPYLWLLLVVCWWPSNLRIIQRQNLRKMGLK